MVALSRGGGSQQDWQLLLFQSLYLDTVQVLKDLLTSLLLWNMTPLGLQVMVEVCGRQWHSVQAGGGLRASGQGPSGLGVMQMVQSEQTGVRSLISLLPHHGAWTERP